MIKTLPSLLEFYGFVYFFGSFLAGPAIEIREYQRYIDLSMFDDKVTIWYTHGLVLQWKNSFHVCARHEKVSSGSVLCSLFSCGRYVPNHSCDIRRISLTDRRYCLRFTYLHHYPLWKQYVGSNLSL